MVDNRLNPRFFETADDPAYQESLEEARKRSAELIGKFAQPFYKAITPEEPLQQQIAETEATQQKLLQEAQPQIQAIQQMQPNTLETYQAIRNLEEDLKSKGYRGFNLQEILGRTGQFLYGDQRGAFEKMAAGQPLTQEERNAAILAPLDTLDFIIPGFATKYAGIGLKNVKDVLDSTIDRPEIRQIKALFGEASPGFVRKDLLVPTVKRDPKLGKSTEYLKEPFETFKREKIQSGDTQFKSNDFVQYLKDNNISIKGKPSEYNRHVKKFVDRFANKEGLTQVEPTRADLALSAATAASDKAFSYLKDDITDFVKQNPLGNTLRISDFENYLNSQGKKFNINYDVAPENFRETRRKHLKDALANYNKNNNTDLQLVSEKYSPKLELAENILKTIPEGETISPYELAKRLREESLKKGLVLNTREMRPHELSIDMTNWVKTNLKESKEGFNTIINKDLLKKVNLTDPRKLQNEEKMSQFKDLYESLLRDPDTRNAGKSNYEITLSQGSRGEPRTVNLGTLLNDRFINSPAAKELFTDDFGKNELLKLHEYTIRLTDPDSADFLRAYFPRRGKNTEMDLAHRSLYDAYRGGDFGDFDSFVDFMDAYGIKPESSPANNAKIKELSDIRDALVTTPELKNRYMQITRETKQLSDYTKNRINNIVDQNPQFGEALIDLYSEAGKEPVSLKQAIKLFKTNFTGHVAHIFKIGDFKKRKLGMKFLADNPDFIRPNYGHENLQLQNSLENVVSNAIDNISKNKDVRKSLTALYKAHKLAERRGMGAYMRFPKNKLTPTVYNKINNYFNSMEELSGKITSQGDKRLFAGPMQSLEEAAPGISEPTTAAKGPTKFFQDVALETIEKDRSDKMNDIFIGSEKPLTIEQQKARFDELMNYFVNNPEKLKVYKQLPEKKQDLVENFLETPFMKKGLLNLSNQDILENVSYKDGGAVKMARGGDPMIQSSLNAMEGMNSYPDFAPDPATDQSFFDEQVESGNLQAANLFNLFKIFGKPKAVATDANKTQLLNKAETDFPEGYAGYPKPSTEDFFFKSHLVDTIKDPNAAKAQRPENWLQFFKGKGVKEAELRDTGMLQFLEDTAKYQPNLKVTQEDLIEQYNMSPLADIEVRIKDERADPSMYGTEMGKARHKDVGSAEIDRGAEDYFEVVINAPKLPGQEKAFVNSSHYEEPNVIGFTRVGTYRDEAGDSVAVIQEMQTDMITELRKEQERLKAMLSYVKNKKEKYLQIINDPSQPPYMRESSQMDLQKLEQQYPTEKLQALEDSKLIKPFPNVVAKDLIPTKNASLVSLQKQIDELAMANVDQYNDPAFKTKIFDLEEQQKNIFNQLQDMNRSGNYEKLTEDVQVPSTGSLGELNEIAQGQAGPYTRYKKLQTFSPTPFNSQADYVDLLLKSTIQAAQQKGINKVAIMPADVGPNPRWGKALKGAGTPEREASGNKFRNLYDQVAPKELKKIAKKYGLVFKTDNIVDETKSPYGIKKFNKQLGGDYTLMSDSAFSKGVTDADFKERLDKSLTTTAHDFGANQVVFTREVSPDQFMDYFVQPKTIQRPVDDARETITEETYELVPLGEQDNVKDAQIIIQQYNPSLVKMHTVEIPENTGPMYMYGKKDGGTIDKDSLVSITEIYGEYN